MQWIVLNSFGALSFLAGLSLSKGASLPSADTIVAGDHRFLIGMTFSLLGLVLLLWGNFRNLA